MEATLEEAGSAVASMAPLLEDLEEGARGLQEAYPQQLPEVPANVVDDVISKDLQLMERASLKSVITTFIDCFGNELSRDTPCKIPPYYPTAPSIFQFALVKKALKQRVRRQCPEHYAEIDLQVRKLLQKNFIVECNEEYYSQVLLVRKSDLSWRFCIDYRYLNKVTEGCSWPIPDIKVLLTLVSGKAFYAVMDCTQGYHQVELTREASRLTAFITGSGMFRWNRLPFGLKGAPSYFQFHMQNSVFAGLIGVCCFVYIDDIIVFGATWVEYLKNLELVLNRLRDWDVKLKLSKCKFGLESAKFLGHVVSKHGVQMDDARKDQIAKMVQPQTVTQLRSFLGMTNYFHDFVEHYANLSYSLYGLLKGNTLKNDLIKWTDDSERAFRKLQKAIVDAPMLFTIQAEGKLTLYTDASSYAAGDHITQFIQGK
jgi:hypothetical protein